MGGESIQTVGDGLRIQSTRQIELQFICAAARSFRQAGKLFCNEVCFDRGRWKNKVGDYQEDNRPGAVQDKPQGEENPMLQALKALAEQGKNDM